MSLSATPSRWPAFPLKLAAWLASAALVAGWLPQPAIAKPSQHEHKRDYKREVEALEEQWRVAQVNNDVPAMDKLLSDDYVGISMNGQVNTKTQQLDRIRTRSLSITKLTLSDLRVKLVGTIAIVTSLAELEGTNEGVSMTGTYRYTRVYQRLPNGAWKITNFEATRVPKRPRPQGQT
jgi:ketosteroid isomerase-like protein